jgi:hypothetical protein
VTGGGSVRSGVDDRTALGAGEAQRGGEPTEAAEDLAEGQDQFPHRRARDDEHPHGDDRGQDDERAPRAEHPPQRESQHRTDRPAPLLDQIDVPRQGDRAGEQMEHGERSDEHGGRAQNEPSGAVTPAAEGEHQPHADQDRRDGVGPHPEGPDQRQVDPAADGAAWPKKERVDECGRRR